MASKKKLIHIAVNEEQKDLINEMGGPTKFFNELYAFLYENYELFEKKIKTRKMIEAKIKHIYKK